MPDESIQNTIAYLIHEVTRHLNSEFDQRMAPLGLTRAQWWVLATLYFNDGQMQTELARDLGFTKVALGGLLDRLEAKGWIKRLPHPTDRRAKCIFKTARVENLLVEMKGVAEAMASELVSGLNARDHEQLIAMLQVLKVNLENMARQREGESK